VGELWITTELLTDYEPSNGDTLFGFLKKCTKVMRRGVASLCDREADGDDGDGDDGDGDDDGWGSVEGWTTTGVDDDDDDDDDAWGGVRG
jgi:hypothetical protein